MLCICISIFLSLQFIPFKPTIQQEKIWGVQPSSTMRQFNAVNCIKVCRSELNAICVSHQFACLKQSILWRWFFSVGRRQGWCAGAKRGAAVNAERSWPLSLMSQFTCKAGLNWRAHDTGTDSERRRQRPVRNSTSRRLTLLLLLLMAVTWTLWRRKTSRFFQ